MDQYAPSAQEQLQDSAEDTLQIEPWLTARFGDLNASVQLPQWYLPSESEVPAPHCYVYCSVIDVLLHF